MDKAEYRSKLEEINSYAEAGAFREAAAVADEIDWKHVRSARTLCMIGEIYEASRRYEDSARILRYAYKRSSTSKTVLYRLAELDIRNGDYDEAKRFINEFEQNSPNDTSRYILRYKLMRAEKAPLDDQIQVLREYKDHEYTERWAYELAKLYRKNGQKQKCIEECDDLILWFTEGKYVTKAMELKMQLTALTPMQQAAYDARHHQEESKETAGENPHANLTGLETVEKAILASSDDEEEEAKSQIPVGDPALRRTKAAQTSFQREADTEPALSEESAPSEGGGLQKKLSNSIRAVFSGLRHSEEDEDADMKIAPEREVKPTVPYEDVPVEQVTSWVHEELAKSAEEVPAAAVPAEDSSDAENAASSVPAKDASDAGIAPSAGPAEDSSDAEASPSAVSTEETAAEEVPSSAVLAGAAGVAGLAGLAAVAAGSGDEAAGFDGEESKPEGEEAAAGDDTGYEAEQEEAEEERKRSTGRRGIGGFLSGGFAKLKKVFSAGASDEEDEEEEEAAKEEEQDRATDHESGGEEIKESGEAVTEEPKESGEAATEEAKENSAVVTEGLEASDGSKAPAEAADSPAEGETGPASSEQVSSEVPGAEDSGNIEDRMAETPEDKEPESTVAEAGADAAEDPEELPQEAAREVDLERLFAETGSALAGEVASGGYVMADTLEDEREQAEAEADQVRKLGASGDEAEVQDQVDRNLIARETDETLGLTREIHLRDAIEQEMKKRGQEGEESEKTPIMRPEEAARRTVAEARGLPYRQDEKSVGLFREPFSSLTPEDGISDEELLKLYSSNEALRSELMVSDADLQDVPEESSDLPGKQAAANGAAASGTGDGSLLDSIISEPEVFMYIPVEGRMLTEDEKKALSYFAGIPGIDYQITSALADIHNNSGDKTSRSGNVIITGRQGSGKTHLAESLILIVCMHLGIKAAKEARLVADALNKKDPAGVVGKMAGGFLIIEAAGSLTDETIEKLNAAMEFRTDALVVILEDEKADMKRMLDAHPDFAAKFTSRITVPIFTNDELVTFARTYAKEEGFKFDEMATLALYTMIGEKQSDEEPMTVGRVRELVDKAIERNSRKLFGKLTDKEDNRVILTEKDFNF